MKKVFLLTLGLILVLGFSLTMVVPAMAQATIYVDASNTTGPWDGTETNPYRYVQDGIDTAVYGDTVQVAAGTYYEHITLKDGVEVLGAGASITTIDGGGSDSVVTANNVGAMAVLDGFTITNGGKHDGGGMCNYNSSPTVTNCAFSGNSVTYANGGGMFNSNSSPTVINCTFSSNSATYATGGGMYNYNGSSPTVSNCTFSDNSAGFGGGMCNSNSSPEVTNCTFSGNTATSKGGGVYNNNSSPVVNGCTFSGNSAAIGGGMYNYASSPTVANCIFSGNSAPGNGVTGGGGIYNDNSSPTVSKCTFLSNSAKYGGGMYNGWYSSPTVTNCTFSDNLASLCGGGMWNFNISSPTVTNCTFLNNSAMYCGGMGNSGSSSPIVSNCTFLNNSASLSGGGMGNAGSSPTVTSCTFSINTATNWGGGIYNVSSSSPVLTNCILWGDSPQEVYNISSSPVVTYCDVQGGYSGAGNIDADPLFVNPGVGDYHLQPGSPCVDVGDNTAVPGWLTTDFEGDPRIVDGDGDTVPTVDMGADEVLPPGQATQVVISDVEALDLPDGIESSLVSKLEAAIDSLDRDQENAAENQLNAFINQVEAQRGKKISVEHADELIEAAQRIIDSI